MHRWKSILLAVVIAATLFVSDIASAAVKKYQVTGKVIALDEKMITVQKADDEKWEIERTASTTVTGTLKIGEKVTIEYKMVADDIEVKKAK
jgi:riboflavin synthase alpha subunit